MKNQDKSEAAGSLELERRAGRRTQEERSAETKRALVLGAIRVIAESGYANSTTNMIAERAGVSRGALQHHFASRGDFMIAVLDEMLTSIGFLLPPAALKALPLRERVERLLDFYENAYSTPDYMAALSMWLGDLTQQSHNNHTRKRANQLQEELDREWATLFADVHIPRERLHSVRRLAMDCLRGKAVLQVIGVKTRRPADRQMLVNFMVSQLADGMQK